MIKILIADDHAIVRNGLKQLFLLMGDISIEGEAKDGIEVLKMLQHDDSYDLLLLDLIMPGINGVNLITRIRAMDKSPPILVFSMHNELQVAKRVLQAGASGFITKGGAEEMLITAIRKVAAGGRFVDPVLAEQMVFDKTLPEKDVLHNLLSERELCILKLIARGKTGNEIAAKLSISNKTVSTHKVRLMQKMDLKSNVELVRYALDNALVE